MFIYPFQGKGVASVFPGWCFADPGLSYFAFSGQCPCTPRAKGKRTKGKELRNPRTTRKKAGTFGKNLPVPCLSVYIWPDLYRPGKGTRTEEAHSPGNPPNDSGLISVHIVMDTHSPARNESLCCCSCCPACCCCDLMNAGCSFCCSSCRRAKRDMFIGHPPHLRI